MQRVGFHFTPPGLPRAIDGLRLKIKLHHNLRTGLRLARLSLVFWQGISLTRHLALEQGGAARLRTALCCC